MASYQHLLHQPDPRPQSPAKVFAMLKSKVQSEALCAREGLLPSGELRRRRGVADVGSPRRTTWTAAELKENLQACPYHGKAQPLTLSPISSPQKSAAGYSFCERSGRSAQDLLPLGEAGQRAFLESTAVSQSVFGLKSGQLPTEPRHVRDLEVLRLSSRKAGTKEQRDLFSPIKNRLRKRKHELLDLNKLSRGSHRGSKVMRPSLVGEDASINTSVMASSGSELPADQSEETHEQTHPPATSLMAVKDCGVMLCKLPPMSTAEQRFEERRRAYNSRRHLLNQGEEAATFTHDGDDRSGSEDGAAEGRSEDYYSHCDSASQLQGDVSSEDGHSPNGPVRHAPPPPPVTSRSVSEIEDATIRNSPESDVQSGANRDAARGPGGPARPILHQDPLVLNSPTISIPKKQEAVLKRQVWSNQAKFPNDSVVFLTNWSLHRNSSGLFIHGTNRESKEPWNTNIIADRVSHSVLTTITGRVYILVGKMRMNAISGFPKSLLKKFANGFPSSWKALYKKFCSESEKKQRRGTERKSNDRGAAAAKTRREASVVLPPAKTPAPCPQGPFSGYKVSRSGRVIKPPLEYWMGGRVTLDADMNMTIYDCYSSICSLDMTVVEPAETTQGPAPERRPHAEASEPSTSSNGNEKAVPLRKVKAPAHIGHAQEVKGQRKVSAARALSSLEEPLGRTRSRSAAQWASQVGSAPPQQSPPARAPTQKPKKESHKPKQPSKTRGKQKELPESSTVDEAPAREQPSDDDVNVRRKKQERETRRGGKARSKSHPDRDASSERPPKEVRKKRGEPKKSEEAPTQARQKPNRRTEKSPPATASSTQSGRKRRAKKANAVSVQDPDEEEWTERELERLQDAVSCFPRHAPGYWEKVARQVGTRSAEECHNQYTSVAASPTKAAEKARKDRKKAEAPKSSGVPVISARAGTLKRKQQVRQFLEAMPKENVEDIFSSAYMQKKRCEIPSLCPSDDSDIALSELEPVTPSSSWMPDSKTPQCLAITPGMMGSPNRSTDDKYVYQLQRRMKKNRFDVCTASPSKKYTFTPSAKQAARRCSNIEKDTFFIQQMFLENLDKQSDSQDEEEDYYFSDND